MKNSRFCASLLMCLSVSIACAQQLSPAAAAARNWRQAHEAEILRELTGLLSIPNVASDTENIRKNADALVSMLQRRHVDARLLTTEGAPPVVYGEIKTPGA